MANSNFSSESYPSSSCSGAIARGIGVPNTIHSDVAPCLPLPSLPVFCGSGDPEIRLVGNGVSRGDRLLPLDRNEILSQSVRIADLLRNTDVSYLNLRDDAKQISYDYVAPLELHNQVLRSNPHAFDYVAPAFEYVIHGKENSWRNASQKINIEPSSHQLNQFQTEVDKSRAIWPSNSNNAVPSRKVKVKKKDSSGVSATSQVDPVELQDTIIGNFIQFLDDICAKVEIYNDNREDAEWLSLPCSDLVVVVSKITSIRSRKLLHLVPGDVLVKLLHVLDHQLHRAEGLSVEEGDHSDTLFCALESTHAILSIMTNNNMPKQIYKEEIIERILEFCKRQLNDVMSACDPSYRALHNPGEFVAPEGEADDDHENEYGSASKRMRTMKNLKFKKSVSSRISGTLNSILQKLCTILILLKDLLLTERLSDSCILQLVKTCFTSFLVDNVQLLQLKAINLLSGIFYKYAQHRVHIIDETVQLLWKLPCSKRIQRAYHLPDEEQRQIQMVSAMLIQLVHSSADVPDALRQASNGTSILEISADPNDVVKCHGSATETCCLFWSRVLQRLTTVKNQDASESKVVIENLVSDLLTTLNLPEYPASIPLLEVLCVLLLQNAGLKSKDISVRSMAIDLLGIVASRLKQDAVVCSQNQFWLSCELDNGSDVDQGNIASCYACSNGKTEKEMFKCEGCHRLFHTECIGGNEHGNPGRAWNCQICICKKQLLILKSYCKSKSIDNDKMEQLPMDEPKSLDVLTNVEVVQQMVLNCLQDAASSDDMLFVRWFYLCLWYKDNSTFQQKFYYHLARLKSNLIVHGSDANHSSLTRDTIRKITSVLGQNSSFSRGFDKVLHMLLASLRESSPVIRAKALRAVSLIVEADPEVLCDRRVQLAVEGRFCDSAISVREAALELVGRHIASHPDVGLKYFEKVAERIKDTGVSVRKRAIKIIRDMCTSNTNFSEFSTACIEIISRVSDDESSIQDLVCKTFYEFWFEEPSGSCTQYYGDGSTVPLEVAKKTEQIVEMSKKMASHQLLITVIKRNLALEFFPQSVKAAGINPVSLASVRKRCELMCQCLLEKILRVEETSANDIEASALPYVLVLHSFCSVDPTLCVPDSDPSQFLVTLQPYLKSQADNRGAAQLLESIIFIIDSIIPLTRKLPKSVAEELQHDLKNMIVRHSFLTVVHACIKCLCSLSKIAGHGTSVVENLISVFFKRLDAQGSDNKQLAGRSLFCLGLLIRYGNSMLNCSPSREVDILSCLELCKRFLKVEDVSVKVRSLQALGYVLIARPDFMLQKEIAKVIETALTCATNVRLKMQALQNMYEYLLDAESQLIADKTAIKAPPPPAEGQNLPVAAGAGDTNICGGIIQLYWDVILARCLDFHGPVRQTALKIVEVVLRQGLVHPITSVPYLIALETDPEELNAKLAHHLLINMNEKYPAFFESRLGDGLQLSFVFMEAVRMASSDNLIATKGKPECGSLGQARLGVSRIYKLIRGNRASRNKFMSSIIRKYDAPCGSPSVVPFLRYCTEILALLPFALPDEPLYLIYTINRVIQVRAGALEANMKGLILYLSQKSSRTSSFYNAGPELIPNYTSSFDLNGFSQEDRVRNSYSEEPSTFLTAEDIQKIQADCLAATALQLLLKLKRHLKIVYGLNDARCQAFSPNEPPKPGEPLAKQSVPFDVWETSSGEPSSYQDLLQRYQEFKSALKEDTADYATYTANIRKKRPTPRKGKPGVDDEDDHDDDWVGGTRKHGSGRKASTGRRR